MSGRHRSPVWEFFTKTSDTAVRCNVCSATLSYTRGNTTSMHDHLKSSHSAAYNAHTRPASQQQLDAHVTHTPRAAAWTQADDEAADRALVAFVARSLRPPQLLDDVPFAQFCSQLQSGWEMPSRRTLMRTLLPTEYARVRDVVVARLGAATRVASSTDLWTAAGTAHAYLTATAHWINESWELCKATLATRTLEVRFSCLLPSLPSLFFFFFFVLTVTPSASAEAPQRQEHRRRAA
jgi:hypothetical protein